MKRFKFVNKKDDMRIQKHFYKCEMNSRIKKISREIYLRNDISCGIEKCKTCENKKTKLLDANRNILIIDINELIQNMDFLYECNIDNILILMTIYERIKVFNKVLYNKLKKLCYETEDGSENINKRYIVFVNKFCKFTYVDNKDEKIKQIQEIIKVVIWMKNHNVHLNLIVISNNKLLKEDCKKNNVKCLSLYEYICQLNNKKEYIDKKLIQLYFENNINENNEKDIDNIIKEDNMNENKKILFDSHLSKIDMIKQLREGKIFKGIFQVICVNKLALVKLSEDDIIVIRNSKNMNRALHNDVVAVQLIEHIKTSNNVEDKDNMSEDIEDYFEELTSLEEEKEDDEKDELSSYSEETNLDKKKQLNKKIGKHKYGKVIGIISRQRKEYGGMIKEFAEDELMHVKKLCFFKAFNNKIPFVIVKTNMAENLYNKRVIVLIDNWNIDSKYPLGRCINIIGNCDDIATETKLIYHEYNIITEEFKDSAYKCLPSNNWKIPIEEYEKRKDYRNILTFSIDPPGCQDIDDALSVEICNDVYKIGVHIADVSYFVKQNSALDFEASRRCTTVYLVNERTDMLPKLLTTNLCSLIENEDRLAYSCIFTFDHNYNVIDSTICKSIIKSNKSYYYEEAQKVIDDKNNNTEHAIALRLLNNISKHLRKLWIKDGALELKNTSEIIFELENNDFYKTRNLKPYVTYETNKLIEAFMLLANKTVGTIIYEKFKSASILRRHPPPKDDALKELKNNLQSIGIYNFKYNTSKELYDSINLIGQKNGEHLSNILKMLTTKCMNEAVFISGHNVNNNTMLKHYGLAAKIYTFFTSPIRRYVDIMVHRILNDIYGVEKLDNKYVDVIYLNKQIDLLNEKNRNARFAARASVDFFSYLYFKNIGDQITNGIILSLKKNGILVYIPNFSIEGICYLKKKNGFIYEETNKRFKKIDTNNNEIYYLNFYDTIELCIHVDTSDVKCQSQFIFLRKLSDKL